MPIFHKSCLAAAMAIFLVVSAGSALAQATSGSISGTVLDPSGAVVTNAAVEIHNPVSGLARTARTDIKGNFSFANVPYNPYHMTVTASGFAPYAQDVEIRSAVPVNVNVELSVATSSDTVNVEAGADLVETDSTTHTDIDRALIEKLPLESQSSSVSSLVTLASPGVSADSNGLFHGMGDHASNSFSVDGQPITDQQSKVFSNQIPVDSIQSLEVISGAPPAEYGGKTSLVIVATTRSGQGVKTPTGSISTSYGTFGSSGLNFDLAYGGDKWGNFISANVSNTGRFLDAPEFSVMHDKGNEENFFDRVDYQLSAADTIRLNFGYSRSWFQNPNSFDQQTHNVNGTPLTNPLTGALLGPSDQRSKIGTFNIAPTWTHLLGNDAVVTLGGFVRRDNNNYYPSGDPFSDFSPDLQGESVTQARSLTNAGVRSDLSYSKGVHQLKAGVTYQQTFLDENDGIGIVDPGLVAGIAPSCRDPVTHQPIPGTPCAILSPYDLTGGGNLYSPGSSFRFLGHADIKELGLYVQDTITKGNWSFNVGIRGDLYNGLSVDRQAQPRLGVAYNIKPSSTVLRLSYARTMESPFNENLIIASEGCSIPFLAALVPPPGVSCTPAPISSGYRNEFHAGLQQAFGRFLVVDAEYIRKYTHNAFDFGVVGSTPIAFPIEWRSSKIPGYAIRVRMPNLHGLSAFVVMSSVAARFFLPQVAGLPIVPPATGVFRIDHDEVFNQTTHVQYQPWKQGPWVGLNWRYDSGQVAGATPCLGTTATCSPTTSTADGGANVNIPSGYVALLNTISGAPLTADQEFQAGFFCGAQRPTPTSPIGTNFNGTFACLASQFGSTLLKVPKPNTENDDHNPQRIAPRNLFDVSLGHDNLLHGDKYKWSLRLTAINVLNKTAVYNFLSTFSGTHYVTPRAMTVELGFHF